MSTCLNNAGFVQASHGKCALSPWKKSKFIKQAVTCLIGGLPPKRFALFPRRENYRTGRRRVYVRICQERRDLGLV